MNNLTVTPYVSIDHDYESDYIVLQRELAYPREVDIEYLAITTYLRWKETGTTNFYFEYDEQ